MFQAPTHLTNARRLFDCVSSIVYSFSYCHTVLNADRRVHVAKCVRLFPHTRFYIVSHLRISFFCFLSFLFFIVLFLYPMFTRISLIALNFILVRNSFDATFSVSVFIRLDPRQRQASYNLYTSLLPQSSCYHAYFVPFRMVSSLVKS